MPRISFHILLLVFAFAGTAGAQPVNPLAPLDTSSPSATFQSFLSQAGVIESHYADYLADKDWAGERRLLRDIARLRGLMDLRAIPSATRDKVGGAAFGYLMDILNRIPEVPAAAIPGAAGRDWGDLPKKWEVPGTEIQIDKVEDGPQAGQYLFTGESIERLPEFHALIIGQQPLRPVRYEDWRNEQIRLTGPLFPDTLTRGLPRSIQVDVLGTPLWKVFSTLVIAALVAVATWQWAWLTRRLRKHMSRPVSLAWHLTTPILLFGLALLADWFVDYELNLSGAFAAGEDIAVAALLYLAGAWAAWVTCFFVVEAIIASPRIPDNSYDAHLLRLTARVCGILAAGAIVIYGANDIGIPALGLVAGLGVGGFAFALASQSTVENLFGGVSIFADRPFRVGDFIHYGDGGGTVEAVGPRSSRIRSLDGTLTTVPNGDLAKLHISNYSARTKCHFQHVLGLRYETSPRQLEWLAEEIHRLLAEHPMVEEARGLPRVVVVGFGASSIDMEVRCYVMTGDYGAFLDIQQSLMLAIMKAIETAGTGFAFPSQTAYLTRDEGIDTDARARVEREIEERRAGIAAAAEEAAGSMPQTG
ncbi:MAG: mechanosensitive ion channel family protein [Bauldia sp.]|uniref:mechanosensitive ion channel family protein n=1 Tax=Bauldia sp. TaxID=2575872 RepID=UPI001D690C25|nr:mechanosensitive ion channel family protein [Bauldia sp.]MCB1494440.1 mechanosensitive ion channel family protein [Bauldia sp.]